jgi:hypothetical protein
MYWEINISSHVDTSGATKTATHVMLCPAARNKIAENVTTLAFSAVKMQGTITDARTKRGMMLTNHLGVFAFSRENKIANRDATDKMTLSNASPVTMFAAVSDSP